VSKDSTKTTKDEKSIFKKCSFFWFLRFFEGLRVFNISFFVYKKTGNKF